MKNFILNNKSFTFALLIGVLLAGFVWSPLIAEMNQNKQSVVVSKTPMPTVAPLSPEPELNERVSEKPTTPTAELSTNTEIVAQVKCPDGYGGIIIESQESCTARWAKISKDAEELMKQSGQLRVDSYNAYGQSLINQTNQVPTIVIPTPVQFNPNINVQITNPTPTPCLKTSTGEIIGICN